MDKKMKTSQEDHISELASRLKSKTSIYVTLVSTYNFKIDTISKSKLASEIQKQPL